MLERWKTAIMVRLARAGDDLRCAEIFLASRRAAFHWQPAAPFDLEDYRRSVEDEEVWVAEMGDLVVGFASIYQPASFIQNLFVDPDWQHHGVGTSLLDRACAHLSAPCPPALSGREPRAPAPFTSAMAGWWRHHRSHLKIPSFSIASSCCNRSQPPQLTTTYPFVLKTKLPDSGSRHHGKPQPWIAREPAARNADHLPELICRTGTSGCGPSWL